MRYGLDTAWLRAYVARMTNDIMTLTPEQARLVLCNMVTATVVDGPTLATDPHGWEHNRSTVRLTVGKDSLETPWKAGLALNPVPTVDQVLESIWLDVTYVDNGELDETSDPEEMRMANEVRKSARAYRRWIQAVNDRSPGLGTAVQTMVETFAFA